MFDNRLLLVLLLLIMFLFVALMFCLLKVSDFFQQQFQFYFQLMMMKKDGLKKSLTENAARIIQKIAIAKASDYNRSSDLKIQLDDGTLCIDEDGLLRVIGELADNAFKFSKPGAPVLITATMRGHDYTIILEDKGMGIVKDNLRKMSAYNQFSAEDHARTGSGLGYIISKMLVELHDGKFEIDSIPGEGTKITLIIPAE